MIERIAAWIILIGVIAIIAFLVFAAIAMVLEFRGEDSDGRRE